MKRVYVFAGQGSQFKGMGKQLFEEFEDLVTQADRLLGYSIAEICLNNPDGKLNKTEYTQPALFIVNALSYLKLERDSIEKPDYFLGHSLGEYNALFAAGAFDFLTGVRLVAARGKIMADADCGGMQAVIGLSGQKVRKVIEENRLFEIDIANLNSDSQTVIAGPKDILQKSKVLFLASGAVRIVDLAVSGAFHSRYMEKASSQFAQFVSDEVFQPFQYSVISNTYAIPYRHENIAKTLVEQIKKPVRWLDSIKYLMNIDELHITQIGQGNSIEKMTNSIIVSHAKDDTAKGRENIWSIYEALLKKQGDFKKYIFFENDIETAYTGSQLIEEVHRAGSMIQKRVSAGGKALLLLPPDIMYIVSLLACFQAGVTAVPAAVTVPEEWEQSKSKIISMAQDAKIDVVITNKEFIKCSLEDDLKTAILQIDRKDWEMKEHNGTRDTGDQQTGLLLYTSGSTSMPKGVMITHSIILSISQISADRFSLNCNSKIVSWLPMYHCFGLIVNVFAAIYSGASVYLSLPQSFIERPMTWLRAISEFKATHTAAPNFAFNICNEIESVDTDTDLSSLQAIICGGEPVNKLTYDRFIEKFKAYGLKKGTFLPHYGMTEAGCISCKRYNSGSVFIPVDKNEFYNGRAVKTEKDEQIKWIASCGKIEKPINILIVDTVNNIPVAEHEIGEIWINSSEIAMGYFNRKQETEESFNGCIEGMGNQYFKTGDLGVIIDGEIFVVGRKKETIIINGKNFYPADLEAVISKKLPNQTINPICVFGIEAELEEKVIVICESTVNDTTFLKDMSDLINKEMLRNFQIGIYEVLFVSAAEIPKTGSGKISRGKCKNAYLNEAFHILYSQSFTNHNKSTKEKTDIDSESRVFIDMIRILLHIDSSELKMDSNLIDYGLNSIDIMRLRYKIKELFGKKISLEQIFNANSIKDLWEEVKRERAVSLSVLHTSYDMDHYQKRGMIPLTYAQKGLWFTQKFAPDTTAYNVPVCLKCNNVANHICLAQAVQYLIFQNPVLNSVIEEKNDEIVLRLLEPESMQIEEIETSGETVLQMIEGYINEPFDLEKAPLMRVKLLKTGHKQYYLLFVIHHIIFDGTSMTIMIKELLETYRKLTESKELEGFRKDTQCYYDFYQAEKQLLESKSGTRMQEFWKERLGGNKVRLTLDCPYKVQSRQKRDKVYFNLPDDVIHRINDFAKASGIQPSTVFLAAYGILLYSYSRQNVFVVGIPVMKREASNLEDAMGYFINMMPMRIMLSSKDRISDYLYQIQNDFIESLSNSDYPFSQIIKYTNNLNRMGADNSLIQACFAYQNFYGDFDENQMTDNDSNFTGIRILREISQEGEYDFVAEVNEMQHSYNVCLKYDAAKYDNAFMQKFLAQYKNILANITTEEYIIGAMDTGNNVDLIHLIEKQVMRVPDKKAVVCKEISITYSQLWNKSGDLANYLDGCAQRGDIIAVSMEASVEWIVAMYGIMRAGCVYVPIDCGYPDERIKYILADCAPKMIITDDKNKDKLEKLSPNVQNINILIQKMPQSASYPLVYPDLCDSAYIIYTSGSTGKPKGTVIEYRGITVLTQYFSDNKIIESNDNMAQFFSIAFDASLNDAFTTLVAGATLFIVPGNCKKDVHLFEEFVEDNKISAICMPPTFLSNVDPENIHTMKKIMTGGSAMDYVLLNKWINKVDYYNVYGPTEDTVITTVWICKKGENIPESGNAVIGKEIYDKQVMILDENGAAVKEGETGEICILGAGLAREYLNNPQLTQEKFVYTLNQMRMYKTGDLGYRDENGFLHYNGRMDEQVKYHGYRIELLEIEVKIKSYTMIKDCSVVMLKEKGIERLLAFCVWKDGEEDRKELKEFLKKYLPEYMIPTFFITIPELPSTINGKVDKKKLLELGRQIDMHKQVQKTSGTVEGKMLQIWERVLHVTGIDGNDSFFEAGGDSVLAVKLAKEIAVQFSVELAVTAIFQYPSIDKLSQYLKSKKLPDQGKIADVDSTAIENGNDDVAVIGISFDIPGADHIEQLWHNLCNSVESVKRLNEADIAKSSYGRQLLQTPGFIPVKSTIVNKYKFDPAFFKLSPRDAEMMNPESRLLLTHSFYAMSDAGYLVNGIPDTSVYMTTSHISDTKVDEYAAQVYAKSGTIATLISYKLGLMGPSIYLNSNCSSSLAALHMACNSIRNNESDYALVGASCIDKDTPGYFYNANMNQSSSGHIKTFDQDADGIVGADGVIVFLLKRAVKALEDKDSIYAVIKGSAMNNDGNDKVGYYAPSVNGQKKVIMKAIRNAGVEPETVGYIEAHGTGTKIGDPIETEALNEAYKQFTNKKQFIGIGSIKSNIGHLDTAAGLAGCLKVILCLKHKMIVPSLNYKILNPNIHLRDTAFYIADKLREWDNGESPRRGAVSSFGIGGTNVHVILEESVRETKEYESEGQSYLIPISAKNKGALENYMESLREYLIHHEAVCLSDVAYTLQVGRENLEEKVLFAVKSKKELIEKLNECLTEDICRRG